MNVVLGLPTFAKLREAPAGASTKHVSMGKAKAKSPPITNFSASMCRLTPMFSVYKFLFGISMVDLIYEQLYNEAYSTKCRLPPSIQLCSLCDET